LKGNYQLALLFFLTLAEWNILTLLSLPQFRVLCGRNNSINNYHIRASIDRIRKQCLWRGNSERKKGGNLVAWPLAQRPKQKGGLGIKNLALQNDADETTA